MYATSAPAWEVASSVKGLGMSSSGALVSETVTVKRAVLLFPDESVAEQLTRLVPSGKVEPRAGRHAA